MPHLHLGTETPVEALRPVRPRQIQNLSIDLSPAPLGRLRAVWLLPTAPKFPVCARGATTRKDGIRICDWCVVRVTGAAADAAAVDAEHMEEDEETSRAIPRWVELEYAVRWLTLSTFSNYILICLGG